MLPRRLTAQPCKPTQELPKAIKIQKKRVAQSLAKLNKPASKPLSYAKTKLFLENKQAQPEWQKLKYTNYFFTFRSPSIQFYPELVEGQDERGKRKDLLAQTFNKGPHQHHAGPGEVAACPFEAFILR